MSGSKEIFRISTALVFLISFLFQSFSRDFIVLDYYINTAAYAKNCVNKEKPKLECNGKCQMMKKAKEEQKKEQDNPEGTLRVKRDNFLSSRSFFPTLPVLYTSKTKGSEFYWLNGIAKGSVFGIFHPPQV